MAYRIELKPAALRDLKRLERRFQVQVAARIQELASEPRPPGARKLQGAKNLWRIRAGQYRVIYEIQDEVLLVLVVRVRHRREAYRSL